MCSWIKILELGNNRDSWVNCGHFAMNVGPGRRRGSTPPPRPLGAVLSPEPQPDCSRALESCSPSMFVFFFFCGCTGSSLQCVGYPVVELGLPLGMWDLNSPSRDQTCTPFTGRWILNHKPSWEVPPATFLVGHWPLFDVVAVPGHFDLKKISMNYLLCPLHLFTLKLNPYEETQ